MSSQPADRRTVLRGVAVAGAVGLGVAACGPKDGRVSSATPTAPINLGAPSEVPVGGVKIYRDDMVVVTQPTEGEYKAFSAVCTHGGCVLKTVGDGNVTCPCHKSVFDLKTGEPLKGPATVPLRPVPIKTEDGKLIAGPEA